MKSFEKQLDDFAKKLQDRQQKVFKTVVLVTWQSIVVGSDITGAPGQPVDTARLKKSWTIEYHNRGQEALISTVVKYGPPVEAGVGPHGTMTLRSEVGGWHSVKLTRAGFPKIVGHVNTRLGFG